MYIVTIIWEVYDMTYVKQCAWCGKEFETTSPQKIYCNDQHYRPCPVCGKLTPMYPNNDFNKPPRCCSDECRHALRKSKFKPKICEICGETFIPDSGVQKVCNKAHYRPCVICGKPILQEFKDDPKVCCNWKCLSIHKRKYYLERYGVTHYTKLPEVQAKFKATMRKKYGVEHALQSKKIFTKYINTCTDKFGIPYACNTPQCKESPINYSTISQINRRFSSDLTDLGIPHKLEKSILGKSFDIELLDGSNTLIELDPTYTHNSFGNHFGTGIDKYYHRDKTLIANDSGYRCIHVFDWDLKADILSMLKPKTSIYARDCKIFKLTKTATDDFLRNYHIQGTCRGQAVSFGLVYDKELIQVMTFGKARYNKNYSVELLRMATKHGYRVIGGASRLFKFFVNTYEISNIISYCDLSKFTGTVYEKIGMKFLHRTPPQEVWSKGKQKITANLLRQRGFDQIFGTSFGKGTNNEKLMLEHGWLPVYDCGQAVYVY